MESNNRGKKQRRSGSEGYWEKYFITVGGISPDWDCYALRDFVKPITERIWVDVNPYPLDNPPRIGQVGSITVNGREDAERLYLTLWHYQWPDGHYFSLHLWNITDNDTKYVRCNCDFHGLTNLCPADALSVYMRMQAPTRSHGPISLEAMSHVPQTTAYLHVDSTLLAAGGHLTLTPHQLQKPPHHQHLNLHPPLHHPQHQQPPPPLHHSSYAMALRQPVSTNSYPLNWNRIPVIPRNGRNDRDYRAVRIGQLHYDATEEIVQSMFREVGLNPILVNIGKRGRGRPAGSAVALFHSLSDAVRAINSFNGYRLLGRRISLTHHQNGHGLVQTALAAGLATSATSSSNASAESITDGSSTSSEFSEQSSTSASPPIVNGS